MWPDRSFRIKQCWVVEELHVLVVAGHQCSSLRLLNLPLHFTLLGPAQSRDVPTVYPPGVSTLELGQQPHVLVVGRKVHFAQDALLFLLLVRILHCKIGIVRKSCSCCCSGA